MGLTINTVIMLVLWLPPDVRLLARDTLGRTFRGYFGGQVLQALTSSGLRTVVFTVLAITHGVLFAVLSGKIMGLQPASSPMPYSSRAREPQKRAALPTMLILSGFGPGQRRARFELCAAGVRSD